MKRNFIFAAAISGILSSLICLSTYFVISESGLREALTAIPVLLFKEIYEAFERRDAKLNITRSDPNSLKFSGYTISWQLLLMYGSITIFAMLEGIGALSAAFSSFAFDPILDQFLFNPVIFNAAAKEAVSNSILIMGLPLNMLAAFFIGKWIGTRSKRFGVAVVLGASFLGVAFAKSIDSFMYTFNSNWDILGLTGTEQVLAAFFGASLYAVFGVVGFWCGKRKQLSRYLLYLLNVLPSRSRQAMVNAAYVEISRAA